MLPLMGKPINPTARHRNKGTTPGAVVMLSPLMTSNRRASAEDVSISGSGLGAAPPSEAGLEQQKPPARQQ